MASPFTPFTVTYTPSSYLPSIGSEMTYHTGVQQPLPGAIERPALRMLRQSTQIDQRANVFRLPCVTVNKCRSPARIARCYVGERPRRRLGIPEKVLMVVGATGAGKTTLVNAFVNYLYGVQWGDDFRFKLIVEQPSVRARSVTTGITAYTIYPQPGMPVPYTLTIVDTPGFGDTSGIERDKEITRQIKEFFSISPEKGGIDHIDGIGFVAQASLARLTHTQRYVFDSILSTFGKDIGDNIFMMLTFADAKKPPVIEAVKAANIPYRKHFKFNNSALYPEFEAEGDMEEDENDFNQLFWAMGTKSLETFFKSFDQVNPKSLQLTVEVLTERERLETTVNGLQPQITEGLSKMEEMHKEQKILEEHEADIESNKDFTREITVTKQRKIDLRAGEHVTNCLNCNRSCHYPCYIAKTDEKYRCAAMDTHNRYSAKCTVCPGQCSWERHVNNPYRFELYQDTEEVTLDTLKEKYLQAKQGKAKKENMIHVLQSCLSYVDALVMKMIKEVQLSLNRLDVIALKPNPLSEVEYIQLLIESEKQEHREGWLQRVQYLQAAQKQARVTQGLRSMKQVSVDRVSLWKRVENWWHGN